MEKFNPYNDIVHSDVSIQKCRAIRRLPDGSYDVCQDQAQTKIEADHETVLVCKECASWINMGTEKYHYHEPLKWRPQPFDYAAYLIERGHNWE